MVGADLYYTTVGKVVSSEPWLGGEVGATFNPERNQGLKGCVWRFMGCIWDDAYTPRNRA